MNKSLLRATLGGALVIITLSATASSSLSYTLTAGATSTQSGAATIDFGLSTPNNSNPVQSTMTSFTSGIASYSGGELFNTTSAGISGVAARPVGSTGNFWSMEANQTGVVTFSSGISYYGFLWGSPDVSPWNTVSIYSGTALLEKFGREKFQPPLNDNNWTTTSYLNIFTNGGPAITKITFSATTNAFETDNHSYIAAVPEPETYAMFLAGLGIMAGVARRRKLRA